MKIKNDICQRTLQRQLQERLNLIKEKKQLQRVIDQFLKKLCSGEWHYSINLSTRTPAHMFIERDLLRMCAKNQQKAPAHMFIEIQTIPEDYETFFDQKHPHTC